MHQAPASLRACFFGKALAAFTLCSTLLFFLHSEQTARAAVAPTNTLTFSETYNEKIVCATDPGGLACAKVGGDQFTVTAKVLLSGVDVTTFTYTTPFVFNLGSVRLTNQLGSDPKYLPGKKAAKFLLLTRDAAGKKTLVSYLINLKWTTNVLNITIAGRTTDVTTPIWRSILANTFAGTPSGPINGTVSGVVDFAGSTVEFNALPVDGKAVTKDKTGKDGSPFTVSKIVLKGKG